MLSSKTIEKTVTQEMLAVNVGSGALHVLGTPVLAALYENAALQLAAEYCDGSMTTVGTSLSLTHDAPTPLGAVFSVTVTLRKQEGRTFTFALEARDAVGVISTGTHTRVAVVSDRFQEKAYQRAK